MREMTDGQTDATAVGLGDRFVCGPRSERLVLGERREKFDDGRRDAPGAGFNVDSHRMLSGESHGDSEVVMGDGDPGPPAGAVRASTTIASQVCPARLVPGADACAEYPSCSQRSVSERGAFPRSMPQVVLVHVDPGHELEGLLIGEDEGGNVDARPTNQPDGVGQARVDVTREACIYASSPRSTTATRRSRPRSWSPSSTVNSSRRRCSTLRAPSSARSTRASPAAVSVTTLTRL